ncbi:MAG: PIN domain-containing protein [Chloroflexi bacterium]|nr:PIN domain-containing protein [Chloroflexota bacterium]
MFEDKLLRVFFDTSVVIAGTISSRGASYILLELAGLTLIDGRVSAEVRVEAERNMTAKLPRAMPALRLLFKESLKEGPTLSQEQIDFVEFYAHPKDVVILAAAVVLECHFLVTLNEKDFWPPVTMIQVVRPGDLLRALRNRISGLVEE